MKTELKKGDMVTIFQKPLTEEDPEGEARLIKLLESDAGIFDGRQVQSWRVRFGDEILTPERKILV